MRPSDPQTAPGVRLPPRGAFVTQEWRNGVLVWRDGPWTLVDPRTTYGRYTVFDGWWREDDAPPPPGPIDGPPSSAAMAAWLRRNGYDLDEWQRSILDEALWWQANPAAGPWPRPNSMGT